MSPGVVSATVNVLTELAGKNAANYLPLAPTLFEILSTSQNNWMLIKVVKLVRRLAPPSSIMTDALQADRASPFSLHF